VAGRGSAQRRMVDGLFAVLAEGPVQDPSGHAARVLLARTGYGSAASLSAVLYRLEAAGLVRRQTRNKRTYAIELTPAGRARLGATPPPNKTTATVTGMPNGPASTWTDSTDVAPSAAPIETTPDQEPETTAADSGGIDYDVLAGVLLKKALQALQNSDAGFETDRLKALLGKEQSRRRAAEAAAHNAETRADAAETRLAQLKEELAELKGRNFGLDTELRITRQNVETLTKRIELAERRRTALSPDQTADLNTLQRELAKLMVQPPGR
jgi:DNA-binding MarR family transcriptional regulator